MLIGGAAVAQDNKSAPAADEVREELDSGIIANPLQRAQIYLKARDWPRLYRHATKWTADFPGETRAWRYLGLALDGLERHSEAADAHLRAWELSDKKDHRIIARIGDSYMDNGEWNKADKSYRKALSIRPQRAEFWAKLAHIALQRRHPNWRQDAQIVLKKVLTFGEYINQVERWLQYAIFLDETAQETGEPLDSAEERRVHRHIVRLDKQRVDSWYRLYDIENAVADNDAVVDKIVQVLHKIDPGNPISSMQYGHEALAKGKNKKAKEFFQQALLHGRVINIQRAEIYMIFGDLEKNPRKAIEHYQQAALHDNGNRAAWENVIVILRGMRRYRAAEQVQTAMETVLRKVSQGKAVPPEYLQALSGAQQ